MSTANLTPHPAVQQLIEQRLDAVDQALLGLLPRQDRLAAVSQVEMRIRELAAASPAVDANPCAVNNGLTLADSARSNATPQALAFLPHSQAFGQAAGGWIPTAQKKRSRLAISAAVMGILSFALLLMIPVTYFIVMTVGEVLGEVVSIALLGTHAVALTFGGMAAIGLGIAALVSLKRRKEQLVGHGWAIAGLCAGPLPMFLGMAAVLVVGFEMGLAELFTVSAVSVASHADSPAESEPVNENDRMKIFDSSETTENLPPEPNPQEVQSVGHEEPTAANQPIPVGAYNTTPATFTDFATPTKPAAASQVEPLPQPAPQSAPQPQPESPLEPGSMPESAPAIGDGGDSCS